MSVSELSSVVFPHLHHVRIDRVSSAGRSVRIEASTHLVHALCPNCGLASKRVHNRYRRRIGDTATGSRETLIHLRVRLFFCLNAACEKQIFAEQVPGVTVGHGRHSPGLGAVLTALALALGVRALTCPHSCPARCPCCG
ncbi:hypothetical protein Aple_075680 [Acrocarpospora pleiomorpha]|uniref:Transposase IS204/IS1001/IS1096/IS1165 zinc-finger domain-containing protein n=1 Tax=Acrocarpospora pleiomorpha TaxID=90975 RepID=A0A5M3XX79_9ACTN|nr:transposase family protein [Acrocarpospora pleiomorpha]GES24669.1 hypothetical protein Aple_075680 [Acrocarpospora pleiomorpha]